MTSKRELKKRLKREQKIALKKLRNNAVSSDPIQLTDRLRTLIIFDTNSLRSTDGGEVVYSSFSFGKAYDVVNAFIKENELQNDIIIAVSELVIDEIKIQMQRAYRGDIQKLTDSRRRMNGLPHVTEHLIGIPDENFDCSSYVELKTQEYLTSNKHVKLLNFQKSQSDQILRSLIERAHKTKPPFFKTTKNSDAGFKDSIIWETLLNYQEINYFHKVILVTKDEGFRGCESEFALKWNKHFKIISDAAAVNTELGIDYEIYIKEKVIHEFAQKEYFKNYLLNEIKVRSTITVEEAEYKIENFKIVNLCSKVDRLPPNEDGVENILITSEASILFLQSGENRIQHVKAVTRLEDDETKEILSTEFNFELK